MNTTKERYANFFLSISEYDIKTERFLVIFPGFIMVKLKQEGIFMSIFNEARKELWNEIQGLPDNDINKRPAENEWSIQEVLDHLKKSI